MSSGPLDDDMSDMVKDDMETFRRLQSKDVGSSIPAIIELVLAGATALVGVVWIVSLYWVPDVIASRVWMLGGVFGLGIFGVPAAIMYLARRGGVEMVERLVQRLI